nr:hypothetical protein [Tanacetum cinerariifolium]
MQSIPKTALLCLTKSYVTWSLRLLWYAKIRPNGKLVYNSIINGSYVRRMIPVPGDQNREVPVNETFHEQTDDELIGNELKHVEADDQVIQTILLRIPEDIYATVDSGETAHEIWLRVQQMMKGVQNAGNQNGLIIVLGITNQNPKGNGNVVAARAEGNATENNGYEDLLISELRKETLPIFYLDSELSSLFTASCRVSIPKTALLCLTKSYVTWSLRLLWYAKSRPNEKLVYNSIINGSYVRRMIPIPGDQNREVPVNETFHEQRDDELIGKELKHVEADDQVIQTILLRIPEDIYATVDSGETAQEIWLRVQQMMKGYDIRIQKKKAKLFNEWEMFISTDGESIESYYHHFSKGNGENQFRQYSGQNVRNQNMYNAVQNVRNQNPKGNGNVVAARAEGNATENNGNQIRIAIVDLLVCEVGLKVRVMGLFDGAGVEERDG